MCNVPIYVPVKSFIKPTKNVFFSQPNIFNHLLLFQISLRGKQTRKHSTNPFVIRVNATAVRNHCTKWQQDCTKFG